MPSSNVPEKPVKPVRIAPWRGPLHFGLLVVSALASLTLQFTYLLLVLGLFLWMCWQVYLITGSMAREGLIQWRTVLELLKFAFMGVTWVFMLRPLRPRPKHAKVAIQITAATQPQLFELIHMLCIHLRANPPVQVWLDTTISVRSSMFGGLFGILTGQTTLHLGLPVISVITARELSGLLAHELSHNAGGISTIFVHAVREMNAWFFRAVMERDSWEMHLREKPKRESEWHKQGRRVVRGWMWAAKIPFMILALASRLVSSVTLWLIQRSAERTGANVIGEDLYDRMQRKLALLGGAWKAAEQEIQRGVIQHRLPENLSLLMARHVAASAKANASQRAEAGEAPTEAKAAGKPIKGEALVAYLSLMQPAASVMRQFVDIARQVTYFYYQHDLGLNLHEHRMVADEEVIHQNRREEEALLVIRRYFGGLAHPERALCGLGSTPTTSTDRDELQREIRRVRDEVVAWGPQFKVALQEWNQAWQRRRDLEAAATLSLAGFTVSRMQFGTEDSSPGALRTEAARQRMVMEHMEGPLQERERILECRFASALGMLWWSEPSELSEWLRGRRRDLTAWVTIYEAMAGALPSFRELLTTFFAFQTLGAKFANVDDPSAFLTALQSVVPKMLNLVRQIVSTMDGAPYPFADNGKTISLNDHLLPAPLPEMPGVSMTLLDAASMRAIGLKMASQASECVAPYVDAFLGLYHRAFAWLAESAERTEMHFMGALTFGSATEILLPDEFTTQRLGMKAKSPDSIAAWKPPAG
ncbi:M48 family metallopeptidase [Prosthecobacter sp.]|uniref:M48 family metallopeptidase n=1 Tax=Prosthecobacter sp. TaxID=1965333 RepID=UPI001D9817B8|nr:M48 family metallopeptidase [Prosthecobacter sp.]MCB1275265.1 M48 family metallopeptidase [Prosthecobacter sp.]